jgi:hypothetical protein
MVIHVGGNRYSVEYRADSEDNVIAEGIGPLSTSPFGGARGPVAAGIGRTREAALADLRRILARRVSQPS